jgi:hypothetical protein
VPLPRTEAERAKTGDPRPSIETLYGDRKKFLARVDAAAAELVSDRFLLEEDVPAARERMSDTWEWIQAQPER